MRYLALGVRETSGPGLNDDVLERQFVPARWTEQPATGWMSV
jgi:hypothetical protein